MKADPVWTLILSQSSAQNIESNLKSTVVQRAETKAKVSPFITISSHIGGHGSRAKGTAKGNPELVGSPAGRDKNSAL